MPLFAAVVAFLLSAAGLLLALPGPRGAADYLVIGSVSTMLSLAAAFALLLRSRAPLQPLYRKRPAGRGR